MRIFKSSWTRSVWKKANLTGAFCRFTRSKGFVCCSGRAAGPGRTPVRAPVPRTSTRAPRPGAALAAVPAAGVAAVIPRTSGTTRADPTPGIGVPKTPSQGPCPDLAADKPVRYLGSVPLELYHETSFWWNCIKVLILKIYLGSFFFRILYCSGKKILVCEYIQLSVWSTLGYVKTQLNQMWDLRETFEICMYSQCI